MFFPDFLEERRCILENVGPDLQNLYDSTGLEVSVCEYFLFKNYFSVSNPDPRIRYYMLKLKIKRTNRFKTVENDIELRNVRRN